MVSTSWSFRNGITGATITPAGMPASASARTAASRRVGAVQRGYSALLDRALASKSLPDDFASGTFTITNLGGLDVDGFTPIINPPQAAILGVGRIVEKPVARDGAVVIRPMVTLSLSFDHRIVDGAPAAKFLQRVKQLVEDPARLLLQV